MKKYQTTAAGSPIWPFRVFLWWLNRRSSDEAAGRHTLDLSRPPPIPGPYPSDAALKRIRNVTGRPSFFPFLSSFRIRRWRYLWIPGHVGEIPARLYRPRGKVTGLLLFMHGGGFVHCNTGSHHGVCCRLAAFSGAMVLSVDYRLAPENRFPAGLDDAWAALQWLRAQMPHLPLAVAGDSAGGNLAAVLARRMRDLDRPLAAQLLFYPALCGPFRVASHQENAWGYMVDAALLSWYCGQVLSRPEEFYSPEFAPVLAERFDGLAPAMIVTAGFDPLRDEGLLYAKLLSRAGVDVRYRPFPRMIHGFLNFYAVIRGGRTALREGGKFLRSKYAHARTAALGLNATERAG